MFHKLIAFCLAALLLQISLSSAAAQTPDTEIAKVKAQLARRGTGEKAKVKIELRDKTKVKGYIGRMGEDDFTIFDVKSQAQTTIAYRDVAKVKGWGLTRGVKIGVIVGAVAVGAIVITGIVVAVGLRDCCFGP